MQGELLRGRTREELQPVLSQFRDEALTASARVAQNRDKNGL